MKKTRISVVSKNEYYKATIEKAFSKNGGFSIVSINSKQLKLESEIELNEPTVVIFDLVKIDKQQVKLLKEIHNAHSHYKVIIVSEYGTTNYAHIVRQYGLLSHISHSDGWKELYLAINIVRKGGTYISESMTLTFEKQLALSKLKQTNLSEKEKELINFIKEGLTSKQIGNLIHRSHRTVDDLRKKLYTKLQVKNKAELLKLLADTFF